MSASPEMPVARIATTSMMTVGREGHGVGAARNMAVNTGVMNAKGQATPWANAIAIVVPSARRRTLVSVRLIEMPCQR